MPSCSTSFSPSGTGLDVLRAVRASAPDIDVYLLTNHAAAAVPARGRAPRRAAAFSTRPPSSDPFVKRWPRAAAATHECEAVSQRERSSRSSRQRGRAHDRAMIPPARKFAITCSSCNLRELCLPQGLSDADLQRVEQIVYARRRVKRGEALFNAGDRVQCDLCHPHGVLQNYRAERRRPRAGDRLLHAGRTARHGRHRTWRVPRHCYRARRFRGVRDAVLARRRNGPRGTRRCSGTCTASCRARSCATGA